MRNFYLPIFLGFLFSFFSISNIYAQPANDDCSGIIDLGTAPIGTCPSTDFTNVNATASNVFTLPADNIPTCWPSVNHDVWFRFDVPANGSYVDFIVTVESAGASPIGNIKAALYRGDCSVDNLAELDCKVAGAGETSVQFDASGLTPGLEYFIRVDDQSATATPAWGTFNVCVDSLPDFNLVCDGGSTDADGILYDSGGPTGNYGNNETCVYTICPDVPAGCIIMNVNTYQLELVQGPDDEVTFYDGASVNAPQIATIEGGGNCFPVQASSGCLTVEFDSNNNNQTFAGFEAIWETTAGPCPTYQNPDYNTTPMADEIIANLHTLPSAVTVTSVSCNDGSMATFTNAGDTHLGMDEGIMLTTGDVDYVWQPNDVPGDPTSDNNSDSDQDLVVLGNIIQNNAPNLQDACILEMDVIAASDEISLEYIFGSDEYNGNVGTGFPSDVFGIWISGPGIVGDPLYNGQELISVVPGTTTPVHLSTVNYNDNSEYYRYIFNTVLGPKYDGLTSDFNGVKKTLTASSQVTQCSTYHIKVAIADDSFFGNGGDSGVFLSDLNIGLPNTALTGMTSFDYLVEGCTGTDQLDIVLSNPLDFDITLTPQISGSAINGTDYTLTLPPTITFPAGQTSLSFPVTVVNDGIMEGTENIIIDFTYDYGCGESPFGNITIEIRDEPDFVVVNNMDTVFVCQGNNVTLSASGSQTYSWSPAGIMNDATIANPIATPATSGPVTCSGTLGSCSFSETIWLEVVDPQINISAMTSTNICQGQSIELTANNNTNGSGLSWSPIGGINNPNQQTVIATPNQSITYTATIQLAGCTVSDDITITVDPFDMPTLVSTDTVLCEGQSLQLANGIPGSLTDFSWSPAVGLNNPNISNPVATPTSNTTYTLTATSPNNFCTQTASIAIEVVPAELEIVGDDLIQLCLGETTELSATTSTNGVGFSWSPDSSLTSGTLTTVTASPDQTTQYSAELIVGGCTLFDTVTVQVDSLPSVTTIQLIPDKESYCKDEVVSFVSPSIDLGFFPDIEFLWTPNDGSFISDDNNFNLAISAQQTATYTRTITNGNCSNTESVSITVIDPEVNLNTSDIAGCIGETVALTASGADNFTWSPGNGLSCTDCPDPTFTINSDGIITVTGETEGCTDIATIPVAINPTPACDAMMISPMDSIAVGQDVELTIVHSGGPNSTIEWFYNGTSTGLTGETVTITALEENNTFSATVTNEFGCTCTFNQPVTAILPTNDVPNVFTPDNDGNNDFFKVVFVPNQGNVQVKNLRVYNRWGQLVYDNETPNTGWDGNHKDKPAPSDVYVYFVEIEFPNGTVEQRKGDVTLIR